MIRQWINTTAAIFQRVQTDFSELVTSFANDKGPYRITHVAGDLSDPHNLGDSVLILTINNLTKVVYKPKDLALDLEWFNLTNKLNALNPLSI